MIHVKWKTFHIPSTDENKCEVFRVNKISNRFVVSFRLFPLAFSSSVLGCRHNVANTDRGDQEKNLGSTSMHAVLPTLKTKKISNLFSNLFSVNLTAVIGSPFLGCELNALWWGFFVINKTWSN